MKTLIESLLEESLLEESLLDDEDIQLDNIDKSLIIGGSYDIDVDGIQCIHWKNIYKIGILKAKSPINLIESPKIDKFDDSKTNNMLESLCRIILNLPIQCLNDHNKFYDEIGPIIDPYEKFKFGGCRINKTVGGQIFFYTNSKSIRVDLGNGIKTYETPHITIPLIKK